MLCAVSFGQIVKYNGGALGYGGGIVSLSNQHSMPLAAIICPDSVHQLIVDISGSIDSLRWSNIGDYSAPTNDTTNLTPNAALISSGNGYAVLNYYKGATHTVDSTLIRLALWCTEETLICNYTLTNNTIPCD